MVERDSGGTKSVLFDGKGKEKGTTVTRETVVPRGDRGRQFKE